MSLDISFFTDCHFHPICGGIVIPGQDVCETCRTEWGQLLRPVTLEVPGTITPSVDRNAALDLVERRQQQDAGQIPKANQRCWLCEMRKPCLKRPQGWECSDCRTVQ